MEQLSLLTPKAPPSAAGAPTSWTECHWEELRQRLGGEDCIVLTANKRLARHLLEDYAHWRHQQGAQVWPRVEILPWQAWCRREWDRPLDQPVARVLSDAQSERLWRQVISAAPAEWEGERVQPVPAQCVKPAAEAWQLLQSHGLGVDQLAEEPDLEAQLLAAWMREYQAALSRLKAIDSAQLPAALAEAFVAQQRPRPVRLVLAGFHELPPELQRLLQQLVELGVALERLQAPSQQAQVYALAALDGENECRLAAHWARQCLQEQPSARIAIIALDLNQRRALLERVCHEVLQPVAALSCDSEQERPFNISLGWALADEPLIHDALLALRWLLEPLDFPRISSLLRSPYLVVHAARQAQLELRLREMNLARASLDQVLHACGGSEEQAWRSARWASRWREFRQQLRGVNGAQSPLFWAQNIANALSQLGWGQAGALTATAAEEEASTASQESGQRSLSSREFQALGAFQQCLEQLAELQAVIPQCSLAQAIHELEQLAQGQVFQAQQNAAPILITEPLQALGLSFDYLWLMGASDELWPEPPRPNPLLPLALQRRHHMPHASAAHELSYAQTVTRWLCASAEQVICSWPQHSADKPLRPSPLVADFPRLTDAPWLERLQQNSTEWRDRLEALASAECERWLDARAPALDPGVAAGGAALIREQAACPFRALLLHRWHLRAPAPVSGGLNALQRGQLLHRALELLYQNQDERSHGELLSAIDEWPARAHHSAQQALAEMQGRWPVLMDERLRANELQRLERALLDWLALDAERPATFQVAAQELQRELQLGPLTLRLRVDRLDQLDDGSGVLIDYKGGQKHRSTEWFGERPREPQLPLYALALGEELPLAAIAFGNLKPGQRCYTGLARDRGLLDGLDDLNALRMPELNDWQQLAGYWRQQLQPLAEDFVAGQAAVDPRDAQVCRHCEFIALCRLRDGSDELARDGMLSGGDNGAAEVPAWSAEEWS